MVQNRLLSWYRKNKRLLPFRDRTEPYIIWLVEIMLQQTQVETVIPYFNKWIHQFQHCKMLRRHNYRNC